MKSLTAIFKNGSTSAPASERGSVTRSTILQPDNVGINLRFATILLLFFCCLTTRAVDPGETLPLLPPHPELQPTFWELHGWQCVLAALVILIILAVTIIFLHRPKPYIPEPPATVARHALEQLRGQSEDGALVMNVSRILKRYVLAALNLPAKELTTTEFRRTLLSRGDLNPELATATGDFLRRCDQWKFAPQHVGQKLGAVEGALKLVEKLEQSREPVAVEESPVNHPHQPG